MKDKDLMKLALVRFKKRARHKFLKGVQEHNPKGDKGLELMTLRQKIQACQEEVMDLWFYLASIEQEDEEVQEHLDRVLDETYRRKNNDD